MVKLAPKEAAEAIRADVTVLGIDSTEQYKLKFVQEVIECLNMEVTSYNLQHVYDVLCQHDIEIPRGDEYPKWLGRDDYGNDIIVNSAEEESLTSTGEEETEEEDE